MVGRVTCFLFFLGLTDYCYLEGEDTKGGKVKAKQLKLQERTNAWKKIALSTQQSKEDGNGQSFEEGEEEAEKEDDAVVEAASSEGQGLWQSEKVGQAFEQEDDPRGNSEALPRHSSQSQSPKVVQDPAHQQSLQKDSRW